MAKPMMAAKKPNNKTLKFNDDDDEDNDTGFGFKTTPPPPIVKA